MICAHVEVAKNTSIVVDEMNSIENVDLLKTYGDAKLKPATISEKNVAMRNILFLTMHAYSFLVLGHSYSDVDCISSMLAISLLLKKFGKEVSIYLNEPFPSNVAFFADICKYNEISLFIGSSKNLKAPDAIFILDVPKPEMIAMDERIVQFFLQKSIPKIEIDHHFSQDARHAGDAPYRLSLRASSSAEIVAQLCKKLEANTYVLEKHGIEEVFSRNIVMVMAAGMMADAKKGEYLSGRRDVAFFNYFLKKFDCILQKSYYEGSSNLSSVEEVFALLQKMTDEEYHFYKMMEEKAVVKNNIALLIFDEASSYKLQEEMRTFPLFVDILRYTTGSLSAFPNLASISCFYYPPSISSIVEFRVRASEAIKGVDFRSIIEEIGVPDGNGGGHAGAVCFKVDRRFIDSLDEYVCRLFLAVERIIQKHKVNSSLD